MDGLREATHADICKAFDGTGLSPSGHFIKRAAEVRTAELGVRTFKDLEAIIRQGKVMDAGDGLRAIVHEGMAIIFNPKTGVLVTLRPW